MSNFKDNPRKKVLSVRLNEDELEELLRICDETGKTLPQLVREALPHMENIALMKMDV